MIIAKIKVIAFVGIVAMDVSNSYFKALKVAATIHGRYAYVLNDHVFKKRICVVVNHADYLLSHSLLCKWTATGKSSSITTDPYTVYKIIKSKLMDLVMRIEVTETIL